MGRIPTPDLCATTQHEDRANVANGEHDDYDRDLESDMLAYESDMESFETADHAMGRITAPDLYDTEQEEENRADAANRERNDYDRDLESEMLSNSSDLESFETDPMLVRNSSRNEREQVRIRKKCCGHRWSFEQVVLCLLALLIVMLIGVYFVLRM